MLSFYLSLIDDEEYRANITRIYNTYLDWMLKIAYHYLKNEADAQDAVNDVFLSFVGGNCSIPLDNADNTKSYLFICIRNASLNLKKSKNKHITVNYDEFFSLSAKYDLEENFITKDTYNEILSFINTMSPIYKDVLTLYICFSKTLKEIAQELNLPFKTVETRFRRGKAILNERFGNIDI